MDAELATRGQALVELDQSIAALDEAPLDPHARSILIGLAHAATRRSM